MLSFSAVTRYHTLKRLSIGIQGSYPSSARFPAGSKGKDLSMHNLITFSTAALGFFFPQKIYNISLVNSYTLRTRSALAYLVLSDKHLSASCFSCAIRTGRERLFEMCVSQSWNQAAPYPPHRHGNHQIPSNTLVLS